MFCKGFEIFLAKEGKEVISRVKELIFDYFIKFGFLNRREVNGKGIIISIRNKVNNTENLCV